ncbi:MAG: YqjD family protein [Lysobacteraceae bacterium]
MNPLEKTLDKSSGIVPDRSAPSLSMEPLIADVRTAMSDAEALLKATAQHGGEALDGIRARTRDSMRAANLRIADAQQAVAAQARDAATATDRYVHQHPWTAIGIGAGVGLLMGFLLRRR